MISAELIGCSTARNKGTCDNRKNIRRDHLEGRVLNALRFQLMDPELFQEFCDEFTREMNRLRMEGRASIDSAQIAIKRIDRELDALVNLILKGGAAERINEKMVAMERRKRELEQFVAESIQPPPLLHPEMANFYRKQVTELYEAFQEDSDTQRISAAEVLRSLIKEIIITPENDKLSKDVRGDLAGILSISQKAKNPAKLTGLLQVKMVAGAGFEPAAFRL